MTQCIVCGTSEDAPLGIDNWTCSQCREFPGWLAKGMLDLLKRAGYPAVMAALADRKIRHTISFDVDYGIDKRVGWSMSIIGICPTCCEPELFACVKKTIEHFVR